MAIAPPWICRKIDRGLERFVPFQAARHWLFVRPPEVAGHGKLAEFSVVPEDSLAPGVEELPNKDGQSCTIMRQNTIVEIVLIHIRNLIVLTIVYGIVAYDDHRSARVQDRHSWTAAVGMQRGSLPFPHFLRHLTMLLGVNQHFNSEFCFRY